jgi:RNA-directed DNA polymerase
VDRLLQQASHQVISSKFELEFKEHSYGFRPGRNAHQALQQAQKNIHDGYDYIVDIDLKTSSMKLTMRYSCSFCIAM